MRGIGTPWLWAGFATFVVVAIGLDLAALDRKGSQAVSARRALAWSSLWIGLALAFAAGLWVWLDANSGRALANRKTVEFLAGYLIEKSLSTDNIFVFLVLLQFFAVPDPLRKRAVVMGVVGAIVLRVLMILAGVWLVGRFHWILYLFGTFLLLTGIKMLVYADHALDIENNPVLRLMRRHINIAPGHDNGSLWFRQGGRRWYTPLFVVVVLIGVADAVFAVDSIPAIFAVTTDPFILITSNVFAILGLRALFFLLADMVGRFHLLKYGLAVVLAFIGAKMLIADIFPLSVTLSLGIVGAILAASAALSFAVSPTRPRDR